MDRAYKITKLVVCLILLCASLGAALFFAIIPFVKVDTSYELSKPTTINVYIDGEYKKMYKQDSTSYAEIMDLYSEAYSVSKSDLVFGKEYISNIKFNTSKALNKSKGIYLEFGFDAAQTLKQSLTTVKYKSIVLEISNTQNMKETNAYFVDISDSSTNGDTFKLTTYAKQNKLYEYLKNLG